MASLDGTRAPEAEGADWQPPQHPSNPIKDEPPLQQLYSHHDQSLRKHAQHPAHRQATQDVVDARTGAGGHASPSLSDASLFSDKDLDSESEDEGPTLRHGTKDTFKLPVLTGTNWAEWHQRLLDHIEFKGMLRGLEDGDRYRPRSSHGQAALTKLKRARKLWGQSNRAVVYIIKSHLDYGIMQSLDPDVLRSGSAHGIMADLRRLYASRSPAMVAHLWEQMRSLRMAAGASLQPHLTQLSALRARLVEAGEVVPSASYLAVLLKSLPVSWSVAVTVMQQALFTKTRSRHSSRPPLGSGNLCPVFRLT
jgi:hypothetical protein